MTPPARPRAYHILLPASLAAYPVIALYAHNLGQVPGMDVVRSVVAACLLGLAVFLCLWAIVRDANKAVILAAATLIFFFTYGHLHSLMEGVVVAGVRVGRHSLLLIAWFLLLGILAVLVLHTRRSLSVLVRWLTIAALFLLAVPSLTILGASVSSAVKNTPGSSDSIAATPSLRATEPLPDIYYVILDGYGRADVLCGLMGIDNRPFLSFLAQHGFYVADGAYSNYAQTLLSLGSSLGMTHLDGFSASLGRTSRDTDALQEYVRHGPVRQALEALGYQTVAFETGFPYTNIYDADLFWRTATDAESLPGFNPFEGMLFRTTAGVLAIDSEALRYTAFGRLVHQSEFDQHRQRIEGILDRLTEVPRMDGPQFVFAHIIAPHPPFVFGPQGEAVQPSETFSTLDAQNFRGTQDEYRRGYADQLAYLNARLENVIETILAESEPPPIILLQGDHGPGSTFADQAVPYRSMEERLAILEAVHMGEASGGVYPSMSPVNLFRVVFNQVFGAGLPLLPDRIFYSEMEAPYAFEEATQTVDPGSLATPWSCDAAVH